MVKQQFFDWSDVRLGYTVFFAADIRAKILKAISPNTKLFSDSLGYFQLINLHTGVHKIHLETFDGGISDTLVTMENGSILDSDLPVHSICADKTEIQLFLILEWAN